MTKARIIEVLKTAVLVLVLGLGVGYAVAAWTNPPVGTPPNCPAGYAGCDAPVNVSATAQTKTGPLTVTNAFVANSITSNATVLANTGFKVNNGLFVSADNSIWPNGFHFRRTGDTTDTATLAFSGNLFLKNAIVLNPSSSVNNQATLAAGSIYYDSTGGKFMCNEGGVWKPCVGSGGGTGLTASSFYNVTSNLVYGYYQCRSGKFAEACTFSSSGSPNEGCFYVDPNTGNRNGSPPAITSGTPTPYSDICAYDVYDVWYDIPTTPENEANNVQPTARGWYDYLDDTYRDLVTDKVIVTWDNSDSDSYVGNTEYKSALALCAPGDVVTGGGANIATDKDNTGHIVSIPTADGTGWSCYGDLEGSGELRSCVARCLDLDNSGHP